MPCLPPRDDRRLGHAVWVVRRRSHCCFHAHSGRFSRTCSVWPNVISLVLRILDRMRGCRQCVRHDHHLASSTGSLPHSGSGSLLHRLFLQRRRPGHPRNRGSGCGPRNGRGQHGRRGSNGWRRHGRSPHGWRGHRRRCDGRDAHRGYIDRWFRYGGRADRRRGNRWRDQWGWAQRGNRWAIDGRHAKRWCAERRNRRFRR